MMSGFLKLNLKDLLNALMLGLLVAILSVLIYIKTQGTIFGLDWKTILDIGIISLIASVADIVKSLLTTKSGNLVGLVKIK